MANPSQDIILLNSTLIASGNGSALNIPEGFGGVILCMQVTPVSGTSPTLNLYLQDQIYPAAAADAVLSKGTGTVIFDDFYASTQFTTAATKVMRFSMSNMMPTANASSITTCDYAIADGSLSAGSVRPGPVGNIWRLKWVIAGTSPSFGINVSAKLVPLS